MDDSTSKKILDSALAALLEGLELSPWVKVPAKFVSELAKRFKSFPDSDKKLIVEAKTSNLANALLQVGATNEEADQVAEAIHHDFRDRVHKYVRNMAPPAMADLVFAIPDASGNVTNDAPVKKKAAELLTWAESSDGPGLFEVAKRLKNFF